MNGRRSSSLLWWAIAALAAVASGFPIYLALAGRQANEASRVARTPIEQLEEEILRTNIDQPGDADLMEIYRQINARHFSGELPVIAVRWEPRLADVGALSEHRYSLEGMFGTVGKRAVILLKPSMKADRATLNRSLSHEMVHASLFFSGEDSRQHGAAFQAVLRRLSLEGAFEGIVATPEERATLRAWLDAESARLKAERDELNRLVDDLDRERADVEQLVADPNTVAARREAYNQRAVAASERMDRARRDQAQLDKQIAQYNLMIVYPDGR